MHESETEKEQHRFLADRMLGKLARYLRIAGFDAVYLDEGADAAAEAGRTGRILLTRNREAAARCRARGIGCMLVRDSSPHQQMKQVAGAVGRNERPPPFSRCVLCNAVLEKVEDRKEVRDRVPPFVYATRNEFKRCPACGRIFWDATHRRSMERLLESIFGES